MLFVLLFIIIHNVHSLSQKLWISTSQVIFSLWYSLIHWWTYHDFHLTPFPNDLDISSFYLCSLIIIPNQNKQQTSFLITSLKSTLKRKHAHIFTNNLRDPSLSLGRLGPRTLKTGSMLPYHLVCQSAKSQDHNCEIWRNKTRVHLSLVYIILSLS